MTSPATVRRSILNGFSEYQTLYGKLSATCFCFHDRDIVPRGGDLVETNKNLDEMIEEQMDETGVKLFWGVAQVFHEPKYLSVLDFW